MKSKRQSRLQRELESSLDGVKWSSGTASPSLPITGTERRQSKRQSRLRKELESSLDGSNGQPPQRCGGDRHCEHEFAHSGCTTLGTHDAA